MLQLPQILSQVLQSFCVLHVQTLTCQSQILTPASTVVDYRYMLAESTFAPWLVKIQQQQADFKSAWC